MVPNKIPVISIVGRSKVGKTTFIERLLPALNAKGIRVATVKHHPHDFEIDLPNKDTYRHKKAGAKITIISSPHKIAIVRDVEKEFTVEEILLRFVDDVDILITEGYKKGTMPKIEVYGMDDKAQPVCENDKNLIAVISDRPVPTSLPRFSRDDVEGVADLIVSEFIGKKAS